MYSHFKKVLSTYDVRFPQWFFRQWLSLLKLQIVCQHGLRYVLRVAVVVTSAISLHLYTAVNPPLARLIFGFSCSDVHVAAVAAVAVLNTFLKYENNS